MIFFKVFCLRLDLFNSFAALLKIKPNIKLACHFQIQSQNTSL